MMAVHRYEGASEWGTASVQVWPIDAPPGVALWVEEEYQRRDGTLVVNDALCWLPRAAARALGKRLMELTDGE